jgi:hypothetical protein
MLDMVGSWRTTEDQDMSTENENGAIATGNRLMLAALAIIATLGLSMGGCHLLDLFLVDIARDEHQKVTRSLTETVCYPVEQAPSGQWRTIYRQDKAAIASRRDIEFKFVLILDCVRFDEEGKPHWFMAQQVYWRQRKGNDNAPSGGVAA